MSEVGEVGLFGADTGTARAQVFIERLTTPRGIATDLAGNVYVHSDFPTAVILAARPSKPITDG